MFKSKTSVTMIFFLYYAFPKKKKEKKKKNVMVTVRNAVEQYCKLLRETMVKHMYSRSSEIRTCL